MSEKVLLIDGHSIINRAFYGIRDLTNSKGFHTNAIYGFLNIFFSIYAKEQPSHILTAFDRKEKTFRHEMYSQYKGTRKPMPEELHEQVPVLKEVLNAMHIKTLELAGYEADDILGTLARMAEEEGKDVVILSGDRDLLQLATSKTMICLPKTKAGKTEYEEYHASDVLERYQVTPSEFIDLKSLMGDASDNIPGIPGIGEKTATSIIVRYKSLEEAIKNAGEIKPKKASENLMAFQEQGRLSKVLATINTAAPVSVRIEDLRIESEDVFYNSSSYELYKELELNRLLSRFEREDTISPDRELSFRECSFADLYPEVYAGKKIGVFAQAEIPLLSVCEEDGSVTVFCGEAGETDLSVREKLLSLFSGGERYVFGLKEILHGLKAPLFSSDTIYDLEIMAYLLNPLQSSYSYDMISKDYLDRILPSREDLIGKGAFSGAYSQPEKRHSCLMISAYCAQTAIKGFPVLESRLEESGMWDLFETIEMPLVYSLYRMEEEGVKVDKNKLEELSANLQVLAGELENEIYREAGETFNINSPQQLGLILFEKMGLPSSKKTKKGYSTSADILEKLAPEYPIVNKILKYRQVTKLKSTYADGLTAFIASDGRIHGTFNQTITATGRLSSTEPNLQNIPVRMELGQEIRKAFTAKEGCVFLDADYSQIELRLLAHLSGDANLIEAYNTEADIHRITASRVFHIPYEEVTREQRRNAKAVNFGIVYGISSFGLSQDLSISRKQAASYIKQYFETYPGIRTYLDETVRKAKINGYVTSMFGRRRPIPELASANFMQRSFGERAAMNSPLQGSAADIMKIAMIRVEKALLSHKCKAKIVLQIHDELLVETPVEEIETVREILYTEMKNAASLLVPLEVDVQEGADWFSAH